jgi:hypothetical protein
MDGRGDGAGPISGAEPPSIDTPKARSCFARCLWRAPSAVEALVDADSLLPVKAATMGNQQPQPPSPCPPFERSSAHNARAVLEPRIATATSALLDTGDAIREAACRLHDQLGGVVDLVLLSSSETHSLADVQAAVQTTFIGVDVAGNTSHGGILSESMVCRTGDGQPAGGAAPPAAKAATAALGLWGIRDSGGTFAVGAAAVRAGGAGDPPLAGTQQAGMCATRQAKARVEGQCAAAGPSFGAPADGGGGGGGGGGSPSTAAAVAGRPDTLCWVMAAPGSEESALQGVHAESCERTVIFGTTSAHTGGGWQLASAGQQAAGCAGFSCSGGEEGVVVVIMRPSVDFTPIYSHGYSATVHAATVTQGDGERTVQMLQPLGSKHAEPAAEVYARWCGGHCEDSLAESKRRRRRREPVDILARSSLFPLRRDDRGVNGALTRSHSRTTNPTVLLHPSSILHGGALRLYARAPVGSVLRLMAGTADSLVSRISVTADALDERAPFSRASVLGALFFFCGGTMDAVVANDERGAESVRSAFANACGEQPFLAVHPFGEQCYLPSTFREPVHANLMFGGVVFGKAVFGLRQRAHIFLSYNWGEDGCTQKTVSQLKRDIESNTRLICWMDLERMGPGCNLDTEMEQGVKRADVFICCLTDSYLTSRNCRHELEIAQAAGKLIVPLHLQGWTQTDWPPQHDDQVFAHAFTSALYVKWETVEDMSKNLPDLVNRIDSEVRRNKKSVSKSKTASRNVDDEHQRRNGL